MRITASWINSAGLCRALCAFALLAGAVGYTSPTYAADGQDYLVLAIQPVLGEEQTRQAFGPLAEYLAQSIGKKIRIYTRPNFLAYWDTMRRGGEYDLVLDAAHFTDYRISKLGYTVLAKIPDTVTYSLIVRDNNPIFDPAELAGKRVATLGTPSIGAARLNAMFPNPVRQPISVEVESAEKGMELLTSAKVDAAILPTPIVSQRMAQGGGISVVLTTEPIPHIALSAAPSVDVNTRERIRRALLEAPKTEAGRSMLQKIGFERFDPATPAVYAGQANTLKQYWGF